MLKNALASRFEDSLKGQQKILSVQLLRIVLTATTDLNAENAKDEADKTVDTLEKQISASKNLTDLNCHRMSLRLTDLLE